MERCTRCPPVRCPCCRCCWLRCACGPQDWLKCPKVSDLWISLFLSTMVVFVLPPTFLLESLWVERERTEWFQNKHKLHDVRKLQKWTQNLFAGHWHVEPLQVRAVPLALLSKPCSSCKVNPQNASSISCLKCMFLRVQEAQRKLTLLKTLFLRVQEVQRRSWRRTRSCLRTKINFHMHSF